MLFIYIQYRKSIVINIIILHFFISLFLGNIYHIFFIIMCDRQRLAPIFFTIWKQPNTQNLKNQLTSLLQKNINWRHYDIYVPIHQQEIIHNYQAPKRWDWDGDRANPNLKQNLEIKRMRYYWAIQTLSRIKITPNNDNLPKDLILSPALKKYGSDPDNPDLPRAPLTVYSSLAFVHTFWCYHGNPNFIGWHYLYLKAYQHWIRFADAVNFLFTQAQLDKFEGLQKNHQVFVPKGLPTLNKHQKQRLREQAKIGNLIGDFSIPFWNWNYVTENGIDYPAGITQQINKLKYQLFYFDPKNPRTGLDQQVFTPDNVEGFIDRYSSNTFSSFTSLYFNTGASRENLQKNALKIIRERQQILFGIFKFIGYNSVQRLNQILDTTGNEPNLGMLSLLTKIDQTMRARPLVFTENFGAVQRNPHNRIHNGCGYPMASINDSGFHPIFWLHHSNVQRMRSLILEQVKRIYAENPAALKTYQNTFLQALSENSHQKFNPPQDYIVNKQINYYPFTNGKQIFYKATVTFDNYNCYTQQDTSYNRLFDGNFKNNLQKIRQTKVQKVRIQQKVHVAIELNVVNQSTIIQIYNVDEKQETQFQEFIQNTAVQLRNHQTSLPQKKFQLLKRIPLFVGRNKKCLTCKIKKLYEFSVSVRPPQNHKKVNLRYVCVQSAGNYTYRTIVIPNGIKIGCGAFSKKCHQNHD